MIKKFSEFVTEEANTRERSKFHKVLSTGTHDDVSKFTGYPKCCVKAFDQGKTNAKGTSPAHKHFHGTGFVPCDKCASTKTGEQLQGEIAKRRQSKVPFPHL